MSTSTKSAEKWSCIWESDDYKAEIYDNCTTRVYEHSDSDKIKIEVDGTKWVGNSGGFHIYKYFITGPDAQKLKDLIKDFDEDEASEDDVQHGVDNLVTQGY